MSIRFITPKLHGGIDYAAAITLIVAPFVLSLAADSAIALWLSVAAGVGLFGYSLFTDYGPSIFKALPYKAHLIMDFAAAIVFLLAPTLLNFAEATSVYYYVMGCAVAVVVLLSGNPVDVSESTT